jgi:hypothetical protein
MLIDTSFDFRVDAPFNGFSPPAIPRDLDTYLEFRRLSIEFTEARNRRIDQLALDVD